MLFKSIGVRGRLDSPDSRPLNQRGTFLVYLLQMKEALIDSGSVICKPHRIATLACHAVLTMADQDVSRQQPLVPQALPGHLVQSVLVMVTASLAHVLRPASPPKDPRAASPPKDPRAPILIALYKPHFGPPPTNRRFRPPPVLGKA